MISEAEYKKTVVAVCDSFASDALSLTTDLSLDEMLTQLERSYKDANSKLHGLLMLVDGAKHKDAFDFTASYIGRLGKTYKSMQERGKRMAGQSSQASPAAHE